MTMQKKGQAQDPGEEQDPTQDPEDELENLQEQDQENNQDDEDQGDEFDQDRALETIRKQRDAEKKLKKQLREASARLKTLEEAEKERQDAEKTDLEKAQERAAELEQSLKDAQETAQALRLRRAFGRAAAKLELKFANSLAEDDAFELADMEGVDIDGDGKVTGLEDALKALQKDRPYLFGKEGDAGDGQGTPPRKGKGGNGSLNTDAAKGVTVRF